MQVWSKGEATLLRRVRLGPDSLHGQRVGADSSSVSIARTAVDSVRVYQTDPFKVVILGTGLAILALYATFGNLDES